MVLCLGQSIVWCANVVMEENTDVCSNVCCFERMTDAKILRIAKDKKKWKQFIQENQTG